MVFCLYVDSILVPSEPQFCHCFSIVWLHFFSIVPQFFHCFPSIHIEAIFFSLLFHSFTRHHFPLHSSLPSVFFTVFPPVLLNRPIVNTINFSFHFSDVSSVLPQCCSISPFHHFFQCFAMVLLDFSIIPLCYPSASNAHPNAPSTIPTVAPHKRFWKTQPYAQHLECIDGHNRLDILDLFI